MKTLLLPYQIAIFVIMFCINTPGVQAKEETFVTIGTGGITGVYYPVGGAICRLVNKGKKLHGIRCTVESTGGSIYNLNAIASGDLDFGTVQSDWQYHSFNGTSKFENHGANKELRAVFSLHSEPFTIITRADSNIKEFKDLKGKRFNIGNPGSGARATTELVMKEFGWTIADFKLAADLKSSEVPAALCDNKIDAAVIVSGHPNGLLVEAATRCKTALANVRGKEITNIIKTNPYFSKATISGGMYRGSDSDTNTFGVRATLVASSKVPDEVVYAVVKAVFENFDTFKALHPAFGQLTRKGMTRDGISIPLHDGAIRYYKEIGLL